MNSYDGAKWEMLNRKLKGIEAVMKGDPNIREVDDSSLGAAMLAGVASGIFSSFENSVEKCGSCR